MFGLLTIKNFQTHRKLEIEIDQHVTTIIGPSDVGKSSIIRALKWLATNRPTGNSFIRNGFDEVLVSLEVDGKTITRRRGKGVNEYRADEMVFKAFGNDVPSEISEWLNVDAITFQNQHDAPFWFSETSGEVSRQLNQIVNLGIIDSTLANLDSKQRETRARIAVLDEQYQYAKNHRSGLAWARMAEDEWASLDKMHTDHCRIAHRRGAVDTLVSALGSYTDKKKALKSILEDLGVVVKIGNSWDDLQLQQAELFQQINDLEKATKTASKPVPDMSHLEDLAKKHAEAQQQCINLNYRIQSLYKAKQAYIDAKFTAKQAQEEFNDEMGEICPLCEKSL